MVRTCKIVTQRFGTVVAEKYRACIIKLADILHWVFTTNLKMFGSKLVSKFNRL